MENRFAVRRAHPLAVLALVLLAAVVMLGCAPDESSPASDESAELEEAAPEATPVAVEGDEDVEIPVVIENETGIDVCSVFIGVRGASRLPDQLPEGEVLAPGESLTFTDAETSQYDIRVDDCDDETIIQAPGVYLGFDPFTWTLGSLSTFTVENESDLEICAVRATPVFATSWGPNLLGEATVAPGESGSVERLPAGTYDVLIQPCGVEEEDEGLEAFQLEIEEDFTFTFTGLPSEPSE